MTGCLWWQDGRIEYQKFAPLMLAFLELRRKVRWGCVSNGIGLGDGLSLMDGGVVHSLR